jgi:hypothetical protein
VKTHFGRSVRYTSSAFRGRARPFDNAGPD